MVFNSTIFVLLFLFVFIQYWFLPIRGKHTLIIIASVLFYTWYSIPFFVLFVSVLILNYILAMKFISQVEKGNKPTRELLWFIVAIDLSILGFFKYFYLLASTTGNIFSVSYLVNIRSNLIHDFGLQIILPIGISFYIFQVIAFVVDCYRGVVNQKIDFRRFAVFILFFPQFVAGPILRATDFLPQIDRPTLTAERVRAGLLLLLLGAVKKILIADRIGSEIGAAWRNPAGYDATVYLLLPAAFLGQIYADFSGYTDMARGMGKLLGYELPENFKGPFLARSMSELWTRWHITLSSWLRDYIYIPLGGSRGSEFRTSVNLFITMALGGFWHGATWNMLLWGIIIGVVLIVERSLRVRKIRLLPEGKFFDSIRVVFTFGMFCFSALFFAAPSLDQSSIILKGILTWQRGNPLPGFSSTFFLFVLAYLLNVPGYHESIREWVKKRPKLQTASISVGLFVVGFLIFLYGDVAGAFIYFAF